MLIAKVANFDNLHRNFGVDEMLLTKTTPFKVFLSYLISLDFLYMMIVPLKVISPHLQNISMIR